MRCRTSLAVGVRDVLNGSGGSGGTSPPMVDAGTTPRYFSSLTEALAGTVVPGSDPSPVILWTEVSTSNNPGTFSDSSSPTSNYTFGAATFFATLQLSANPSDGPAVTDTVSIQLEA